MQIGLIVFLYSDSSLSILLEVFREAIANQAAPESSETQDDPVAKDRGAVGVEEGSAAPGVERLEVNGRKRESGLG